MADEGAPLRGLGEVEAAARLRAEGPNELAQDRQRGFLATAAAVVKEPMLLLLLAAGAIYFLLGDLEEALILISCVVVVIAITLAQERKTERALAALRDLSSPRALVVRDGARRRPGSPPAALRGETRRVGMRTRYLSRAV